MAAVPDILEALETRVKAVLPSSYKRLRYTYDLEKNDLRKADNGYCIGVGAGETVTGSNKAATIDQTFFMVITDRYTNRTSDKNERTILKSIYTQLETIYKDIFQSKAGLGSIILVVQGFSFDEPEKLSDGTLSVRMDFSIKYRVTT